ncbi:FkbM family methyltransferase [Yoonia sp. 2307UL14-13]|uniref:FkbM family methyltransferase n=1 Tax=Yoonia sp. 2307UL14-13 TaxID=3126506 RepID=UPI0030A81296
MKLKNLTSDKKDVVLDIVELIKPVGITEQLIRVGSENDGGYLIPLSAHQQDALVSPGVSSNSSFEISFADQGTKCSLFDASVLGPSMAHDNIEFHKVFWGVENNDDTINAIDWLSENIDKNQRNALQMDIEGAEYDIINHMPINVIDMFNLVIIEVHGFQRILKSENTENIVNFFKKITQNHKVVHFHPNNNISPVQYRGIDIIDCFELTLVRNDYPYFSGLPGSVKPHELDMPCVPEEIEISVNWDQIK